MAEQEQPSSNIRVIKGDIWAAPSNSCLIHACNCQGSWGSGIAAAFKRDYPAAYEIYHSHCLSHQPSSILGTCLIIAPQPTDTLRKHHIACLFTSVNYGRNVDSPEKILNSTRLALENFVQQLKLMEDGEVGELHGCKINSARFGVPWEDTLELMEDTMGGVEGGVTIYDHDEPANAPGLNFRGRGRGRGGRGRGRGGGSGAGGSGDTLEHTDQDFDSSLSEELEASSLQEASPKPVNTPAPSVTSSSMRAVLESFFQDLPMPTETSPSVSSDDSIDINNLPYKAPLVHAIPVSHRYRTVVRDGPLNTPEGADARLATIARRSFRGAGRWRAKRAPDQDVDMDQKENSEEDEDDDDGEVEVMWSTKGESFQLMRDPSKDGSISQSTHWVNRAYFES